NPGPVLRAMFRPAEARLEGVAIEYGLYQGRFWLPRSQVAEGTIQLGMMRMPMRIEERFAYAGVNAADSALALPARSARASIDTTPFIGLPAEERRARIREARHRADSADTARRKVECASTGSYTTRARRYDGALEVGVRVPCDSTVLANSPDLPKSSFASGEEIFGD